MDLSAVKTVLPLQGKILPIGRSNDQKTLGELFVMIWDDIQDMDLTTAL